MSPAECPRCGAALRPPGLMHTGWQCPVHGLVLPLHRWHAPGPEVLRDAGARSRVPIWVPLPMPIGWTVGGLELVGDERGGVRGVCLALCGPSPLGGPADLLLIAEEPGVGLAARRAGLTEPDPDLAALLATPSDAKVGTFGHPTALWRCAGPADRAAFVGEAAGVWFWAVLWPPAAELLLVGHVALVDLREQPHAQVELPVGAPSPRLL